MKGQFWRKLLPPGKSQYSTGNLGPLRPELSMLSGCIAGDLRRNDTKFEVVWRSNSRLAHLDVRTPLELWLKEFKRSGQLRGIKIPTENLVT